MSRLVSRLNVIRVEQDPATAELFEKDVTKTRTVETLAEGLTEESARTFVDEVAKKFRGNPDFKSTTSEVYFAAVYPFGMPIHVVGPLKQNK